MVGQQEAGLPSKIPCSRKQKAESIRVAIGRCHYYHLCRLLFSIVTCSTIAKLQDFMNQGSYHASVPCPMTVRDTTKARASSALVKSRHEMGWVSCCLLISLR
jgi:hypothetical protein